MISNLFFNKTNKTFVELQIILVLTFLMFIFIGVFPENLYPDHEYIKDKFLKNFSNDEIQNTPQAHIIKLLNFFKDFFCTLDISSKIFFKSLIKGDTCQQKLYIKDLGRLFYVIITFSFIIFLYIYNKIINKKHYINNCLFLLTLIMPSTLLSITALSSEAIYTVISIFIMANINFKKIASKENFLILPLLFYSYFLDVGNLYVFLSFLLLIMFALQLRLNTDKYKFYFTYFIIILSLLVFGKELFLLIGEFINESKTKDLINDIEVLNLHDIKFSETLLRMLYFWVTLLNLYFPHQHIVSIFSLFIWLIVIVLVIINNKKLNFYKKYSNQIIILTILPFSLILINILPTHAYGKYYMFMLVLVIKLLIDLLNFKKIIFILPLLSLTSIFEIAFFNGFSIKNFLS